MVKSIIYSQKKETIWSICMYLCQRNRSARIVSHDLSGNPLSHGAVISTPHKVVARNLDVKLVLARRDRRGDEGGGVGDALESRGGIEASLYGFLDAEYEEDEEEGGEELEERGPLVPP